MFAAAEIRKQVARQARISPHVGSHEELPVLAHAVRLHHISYSADYTDFMLAMPFILIFAGKTMVKIDPVLEQIEPIPLEELRERLCREEIASVDEDDEEDAAIEGYVSTLSRLRHAANVAEMADAVGEGWAPGIRE